MSATSKIEWTDATWNPVRARSRTLGSPNSPPKLGWHCEHVSEGCRHCYAETMNRRLGTGLDFKPGVLAPRGPVEVFLDETMLLAPLRWKKPRMIFAGSMTDLFGPWVTDAMLDRVFAAMALCPQHVFQLLTKRPERMREYVAGWYQRVSSNRFNDLGLPGRSDDILRLASSVGAAAFDALGGIWPLPNVWLGTSVEDQAAADARIPHLLATPAAVRFLSCEPLLGAVDLTRISTMMFRRAEYIAPLEGCAFGIFGDPAGSMPKIGWVIAGGESGPGARPMHPDWARGLRDQCAAAGVPFFFKQWGEWGPIKTTGHNDPRYPADPPVGERMERLGKRAAGRLLDGVQHDGMPK